MVPSRLTAAAAAVALLLAAMPAAAWPGPGRMAALVDLEVDGPVSGDVIVLAGDVELGPSARVEGHVIAVFGAVQADPAAQVEGRVLSVSSLATLTVTPVGPAASGRVELALRLLLVGLWLVVTTLLAFLIPARLRRPVALLPRLGLKVVAVGLLVVVTFVAALVAALGLGPALGVPLTAALFVLVLSLKILGLTLLGGHLGGLLWRRLGRLAPLSAEVLVGVGLLLACRFVPILGEPLWTLVSVAALGAGLFALALAPRVADAAVALGSSGGR